MSNQPNFQPVSSDLLWQLTRANSSFLLKRDSGRLQMSTEPYNLTGMNSFKYSGLCNGKAAGLTAIENGAQLSIKSRGGKNAPWNKSPVKVQKNTQLAKDFTRDFRRVSKCVKNTVGGYYRPDLVKPALARWTKIHRSLLVIKKSGAAKKK